MSTVEKLDLRKIRYKLGLNQQQFWSKLGITQSGGSRYESGRKMPKPISQLLRLIHVEQIDVDKIKGEDYAVIEYLRAVKPALLKELKKETKDAKANKAAK